MISRCFPLDPVCQVGGAVAGTTGSTIADALINAFATVVEGAAAALIDHVLSLVAGSGNIDVKAPWFGQRLGAMATLMSFLLLPLLLAGTVSAVLHQDLRRLARTWLVALPAAIVVTFLAVDLTQFALKVANGMTQMVTSGVHIDVYQILADTPAVPGTPPGVAIVLSIVILLGALAVWLELLVRSAAVYVAVFFLPLALAGMVWPATAHLARRMLEGLSALILVKFVIVTTLTLGAAAVEQGRGIDQVASGAAILLIAAFAPFVLFRMVPVIEAASLSHLAGVSRQPFRAAQAAAGTAASLSSGGAGVASSAINALRRRSGGGGGDGDPENVGSKVAARSVPQEPGSYRTSDDEAGGRGPVITVKARDASDAGDGGASPGSAGDGGGT